MTQPLRVLADFTEDPSEVSNTHVKSLQLIYRNLLVTSFLLPSLLKVIMILFPCLYNLMSSIIVQFLK